LTLYQAAQTLGHACHMNMHKSSKQLATTTTTTVLKVARNSLTFYAAFVTVVSTHAYQRTILRKI